MHPQYELDHINSVFHQNYRDAHLDYQLRTVRRERTHRIAALVMSSRARIGAMLIAGGDRIRPQAIPEPQSAAGSDANCVTGAPASRAHGA